LKELVLVTGGAGFIGSHTVDLLLHRGYSVRILDSLQPRVHPRGRPNYLTREAELVQGDVVNPRDLSRALRGVTRVIHLAAYQDYQTDFSTFIHVNTESAALLFELIVANRLPVERIVFASSQAVAGEGRHRCPDHGVIWPDQRPLAQLERGDWEVRCPTCGKAMEPLLIDESSARPHTPYGISKLGLELLAGSLGRRYGISTSCMRYTYVQGARNSFFNAYSGICRIFALRILNGLPPVCFEDGGQMRDYVHVGDVARANLLALENPVSGQAVYNVGGGRALTVLEFASTMLSAAGSSLEPAIPGTFRMGDTRHTISDISALRALGWEPTIGVEHSVREYLDWIAPETGTRKFLLEAEAAMRAGAVVRQAQIA
jgi:dTDP-L-rhamnose 4-epimerase